MTRWLALAAVMMGCSTMSVASDGGADAGRLLRVAAVVDLGMLPLPSTTAVGRDGVSSGVVDGQLLWTFGDTFVTDNATTIDGSNVVTATGAWATPASPLVLEQPVDAHGIPAQLVPYTQAELDANRMDATNGWALWPGAVIDTGAPALLFLFQRIRRMGGSGFEGQGLVTARIAPHETVATRAPADLFTRPEPLYGVGGVSVIGDTAYWLACESLACRIARTPRARADDRSAFEFWDGHAWVADIGAAAVVAHNVASLMSISWNAWLGRYLSVSSQLGSNDVILRTAAAPEGPWPASGLVVHAAAGGILAAGEGADYLAQEHVALSSADGREIVISYARPLGSFRGEVRLARITLE
jgi:hypothetical protein